MENGHIFENIFYIFHGHLELITNLIVYASTFAGLKLAPIVTTYTSFAVQTIPIFFIIRYHKTFSLTRLSTMLVVVIAVGLPQALEVWANSINLHFHLGLLAALIAAINPNDGPPKWVSRLLLAMAGLGGIPANFLVPVFAMLAIKTQQAERRVQCSILSLTAALQILLLIFHHSDVGSRDYFPAPLAFWLASIAQSVASPLFGFSTGEQLVNIMKGALDMKSASILLAIFLSIPLVHLFMIGAANKLSPVGIIIISAFTLLFMSLVTALGNKEALISSANSGRYFYASNILFAIAFLASIKEYKPLISIAVFVLTISSLINVNKYTGGPDWKASFSVARSNGDTTYNIWPAGWIMVLQSR